MLNKKKRILRHFRVSVVALAALALSGCGAVREYYQVCEFAGKNVQKVDGVFTFENADCVVRYDFWSEYGKTNFLFTNKSDKDLFVILPSCYVVKNGIVEEYFVDGFRKMSDEFMESVGTSSLTSKSSSLSLRSSQSSERSTIVRMDSVLRVPAGASKQITGVRLLSERIVECADGYKQQMPSERSDATTYGEAGSPLRIKNHIAYSFTRGSSDLCEIDNEFWVCSRQNVNARVVNSTIKPEYVCNLKKKQSVFYGNERFVAAGNPGSASSSQMPISGISGRDKFFVKYRNADYIYVVGANN